MVVAVRSLSRSEQVETLLAGPSPISSMKAEITIPYFQHTAAAAVVVVVVDSLAVLSIICMY